MIPVTIAPEPPCFHTKVRIPGERAIAEMTGKQPTHPRKTGKKRPTLFATAQLIPARAFPKYWTRVLPEMIVAYEQRCAYLAMYIPYATGNPTVDHVLPKSYAPDQVYEWTNYRLCCGSVNAKKGALLSMVDPCAIGTGWFKLDFLTRRVRRGAQAPASEFARIDATLRMLNAPRCVLERQEYVRMYQQGPGNNGFDLAHLEYRAPFIASELRRQCLLVRGDV